MENKSSKNAIFYEFLNFKPIEFIHKKEDIDTILLTIDNHNKLFNLLHPLQEKRVTFMMSNADVSLVREKFANASYHISTIECKRSINSKKPQSKTMEVFVKNY